MVDNKLQMSEVLAHCLPVSRLQAVLSGKWKILILWYVAFYRVQHFGVLLYRLDGITQSTLARRLRELEADGLLHRGVYPEVPPRMEYTLMAMGESFLPVLSYVLLWSKTHLCPPDYVSPYQDGGRGPLPGTEAQEIQRGPEPYGSGPRQRVEKVALPLFRERQYDGRDSIPSKIVTTSTMRGVTSEAYVLENDGFLLYSYGCGRRNSARLSFTEDLRQIGGPEPYGSGPCLAVVLSQFRESFRFPERLGWRAVVAGCALLASTRR